MDRAIRIFATAVLLAFCLHIFAQNQADVDLWGNVGFVRAVPGSSAYLYQNTFSFTESDSPWINHEWLSELIFYRVHRAFGNPGLVILKIVLGFILLGILYASLRLSTRSGAVHFFWLLLAVSTLGYGFSTRPQLFTYILCAAFLLVMQLYAENRCRRWLYALAPTSILWANLHGAFFIGAILLLLFGVAQAVGDIARSDFRALRDRTLPIFFVCVLFLAGTMVNPYGADLWDFIAESSAKHRPYLTEWQTFNLAVHLSDHVDFLILAVFSGLAMAWGRPRSLTWSLMLIVALLAALLLRRNIPLFAIVAVFAAPRWIEGTVGPHLESCLAKFPAALRLAVLPPVALLLLWLALTFNKTDPLQVEVPRDAYPVELVQFIKDNKITGNLLPFWDWSEYCIWHLYPDCRVFMDGRYMSAYGPETIDRYFNYLGAGRDWHLALVEYPVDMQLLHKDLPIYKHMSEDYAWVLVAEDEIAGLFMKFSAHPEFFERLHDGTSVPQGTNTSVPAYFP